MSTISSVKKTVAPVITKPLAKIGDTKFLKWIATSFEKDSVKAAGCIALTSIVAKDALGCYLYVKQSLANKEIPEKKRGFVAALDLTNGLLMIGTQLIAFFTISKENFQKFVFDNTFGHLFNNGVRRNCKENIKKKLGASFDKKQFNVAFQKAEVVSRSAFKFFLPLVSSTIIAKRMVVPFIATPTAGWVRKNILHDNSDNENIVDEVSLSKSYSNIKNKFNMKGSQKA